MHVRTLHPWDVTPTAAVQIQREFTGKISQEWPDSARSVERARLIGGVDVSCTRFDPTLTAGVIVWDRETEELVDAAFVQQEGKFPYIPGLLSFREIPALALALEKLTTEPDVLLVDGQGRAHPRRLGIASHLGLLIDQPTIGVGKSRLCGHGEEPADAPGSITPLVDHGEEIGRMVRLRKGAKPVYVSVGNRIDLSSAVDLVLRCSRGYRLPEPTRLAHLYVNAMRTGGEWPLHRVRAFVGLGGR